MTDHTDPAAPARASLFGVSGADRAAPELHDEMDRCVAAGCKVIGACPSADGSGVSVQKIVEAAEFCCT